MNDSNLICVGNAIVDILVNVDDQLLQRYNFIKGSMHLINEDLFNKIFSELDNYEIKSGGSAANTAVGYSSFGGKASFIGTVGNDEFGLNFKKDLMRLKINSSCVNDLSDFKTSKCLVLVSKDGDRTMCTYLCASTFLSLRNSKIDSIFKKNDILYLEGYLFDQSETKKSMIELCKIAKKKKIPICLSLADS